MLRYSSVAYGIAAGLMAVAACGLWLAVSGGRPNVFALASLFVFCIGAVVFSEGILAVLTEQRTDELYRREREMTLKERAARLSTAARPAATVIRTIPHTRAGRTVEMEMAETRSPRWLAWQTAAERTLAWAESRRGRIDSGALVGRYLAFTDPDDWGRVVDELHRVGLSGRRVNGKRTELVVSLAEAQARVSAGEVDWDETTDAPLVADPPALPAARTVEHQTA